MTTLIRAQATATIARPIGQVFAFLADPVNVRSWDASVVGVRILSPGPLGRGSVLEVLVRSFGRRWVRFEIVEFEPERLIRFHSMAATIAFRPDVTYRLEPADGATRLTRQVEIRPTGLVRLLAPMLSRGVRAGNQGHVAAIKTVLERGSPPPASGP